MVGLKLTLTHLTTALNKVYNRIMVGLKLKQGSDISEFMICL